MGGRTASICSARQAAPHWCVVHVRIGPQCQEGKTKESLQGNDKKGEIGKKKETKKSQGHYEATTHGKEKERNKRKK